ncbi:ABC transporter B family member 4-like isoform X1 [Hordeum vulgare subsp. vulgare]|uniref:ABC transporter B family member 4-like isoform X1 n=1 Tax=Hordeum vulgare subsp. vulgare TaxID=112509 RepID=UPI001D1A53AD|nr:ABC transporter B family member 4-like isoform X1 [Hordeum vulgare subsp. vulgare]
MFAFADRTDAALMAVGAATAVANGMAQPLMTFIFGDVIDAFGSAASSRDVLHRVTKVILNFVYLGIGAGLASTLQVSCWTITGERQAARIRAMYLKAILRQDIAFFDKEMSTGQVVERMSGDTFLIQDAIGEKVGKIIQLLSTFFGGFIVAFVRGWLLALVMLSSIPPVAVAGAIVSRMMTTLSTEMQAKYGDAGDIVEQTIGTIRTVVSFNGEKQALTTYNKFIRKAYESARREGAVSGLGVGSVMAILFCSYGLAVWYGSKLIVDRGYNGGIVINVIMSVMVGAMSLGQAAPSITAFAQGQGAAHRMFKTIERRPCIDVYNTTGIIMEDIKGDVELKDVYFSYPTRPEHLVFDGFSLRVPSGTTMALVGVSGSGKSTVVSLVERFYDPQSGEVLIDGVDIRRLTLGWIRGKIGLVSQEPVLFSSTIRENIAYGKDDLNLEEIRRAIELANAANFIDKLPNGLETMVGERGIQLSGGQKQRIAIARAIIKNPRILLLDEATSALDMESERVVQEALERVMLERTTIIVAHRLSTVKNADVISVLQHGKMVEQGSHVQLVNKPEGAYSQLIHLQETLQQAETHKVDPDAIMKSGFGSRSFTRKPRSQGSSFRRSTSKGSSFGHSGTHPYPAPCVPMEVNNDQDLEETADKISSDQKKAPIGRLFYLNKPEALVLALGSIAAAMHGTIFPVYGILISSAIKTFYEPPAELLKDSRFWASMFVMLGACALVLIPIEYFLFGLAGGKLVERIRSLAFRSVMHQEINWFDKPEHSSGAIGARLSTDALNVKRLVGENLALNVQTISTVIAGFTIAMVANWKLALIITVVVPLLKYEEASQVATDAVGGIRTVASFCAEQKVMDAYEKKCEIPTRQGMREGLVGGLGFGFSFLVFYLTYALCFYVGAKFVHEGTATFPEVFRVFFVLVLATSGISRTSAVGADSTKANESAISVFEILDRKSKIDSSSEEGMVVASVRGDLEFQNVCFSYPLRPNVQIFTDLSLSIPSGKTAALVGESGSGKSTAIALLERFYDPSSGKILLDGVELPTLKVSWLRLQIGLVAQEPVLFNDTIRANIAYGKQGEASEEEIVAAAEAANAHQFISGLPDGYNTVVGERGIQLSGGQKQRVAIARAVVKDPKVLLLDEATSALDAESERVVQEALDRVMVGRTTVVVAHRLSTVRGADIISVVKNGTIVEKGRHEELMRMKDGAYASLVELSSTSR